MPLVDEWVLKSKREELLKGWEHAKIMIAELTFEEYLIAKIVVLENENGKV